MEKFCGSISEESVNVLSAKKLFNRKRLDLIVKYLFAKEILDTKNNLYSKDIYKDLYIRHILMRTMGKEPVDIYGNQSSKQTVDDYVNSFRDLIFSIDKNGFDKNNPVPVSSNNLIANGAHRVAACLTLNKEIVTISSEIGIDWGFDWFCNNGFNVEDKQRILKGFIDINTEKCAIFVVWNPLFKYIDNVKTIINKYFDIVGDIELDFENNYIAFTNSLLEIYDQNIAQSVRSASL